MAFLLADKSLLLAIGAGAIALTVVGAGSVFALSKSPAASPEAVHDRQETARFAITEAEKTVAAIAAQPAKALANVQAASAARQEARVERREERRAAVKSAATSVFQGMRNLTGAHPLGGIKAMTRLGQ